MPASGAHALKLLYSFFSLVYVTSLSLEREGCNIFAAENPKITEALGGTVQRYYRSFHRCLPSDMTNIEPELINPSDPGSPMLYCQTAAPLTQASMEMQQLGHHTSLEQALCAPSV